MRNYIPDYRTPRKHNGRSRRGAAYSLSVVMILPVYILCLAFAIEINLLMNSRLALAAGLEAAAHATSTWSGHRRDLQSHGKTLKDAVHNNVTRAMVPFAFSGREDKTQDPSLTTALRATDFSSKAIERYSKKLDYLQQSLDVQVIPPGEQANAYTKVTLTFDSPICFRFFAPLLADRWSNGIPVRRLEMSTIIPMSRSQLETTHFGLPYSPQEAAQW